MLQILVKDPESTLWLTRFCCVISNSWRLIADRGSFAGRAAAGSGGAVGCGRDLRAAEAALAVGETVILLASPPHPY